MARAERVLAIDIGSSSLKVGEIEYLGQGELVLCGYDFREYDQELTEENRREVLEVTLRAILESNRFAARKALVCVSGQAALTRFVKLPPVADEEHRVRQIVEFEAQQNVPFPMSEVLWDYQLIASDESDELEVMFVVIKNEIVEQITGAIRAVGLELHHVDVAPVASYNAARANHVGDDNCGMLLNIGARSTNLVFVERNKFFTRTIPIAGHTVTQQIAKEFGISFEEAEELKRRHGFVALGGAYEEPESEVAAAVSKIIRNVMARLHGEINRSINVYRAQQKGSRPVTLLLTGGSSTMACTDQFFAEKLRMEVDYFNPFQIVTLGPEVDSEDLTEKAHMFSEIVGTALRYRVQCPVEVSLVPAAIRREQLFARKKPYLAACAACLILFPLFSLLLHKALADRYRSISQDSEKLESQLRAVSERIVHQKNKTEDLQERYEDIEAILARREHWPRLLSELTRIKPENLWIDSILLKRGQAVETDDDDREEEERGPAGSAFFGMGGRPRTTGSRATRDAPGFGDVGQPIVGMELTVSVIAPAGTDAVEGAAQETRPELRFLASIRESEVLKVDEDQDLTEIRRYQPSEKYDNLRQIVLDVQFAEPYEF